MTKTLNTFVVVSDFLTEDEKDLIRSCAAQRVTHRPGKTATELRVRELGRVGRSGARLLLCKIDGSVPFVVKIADSKKIKRESQAIKTIRNYFRDAEQAAKPVLQGKLGALLYWHHGGVTDQQIRDSSELTERVYDFSWSDKRVSEIFGGIADACGGARSKKEDAKLSLRLEYERYLRHDEVTGDDKPTRVLASLFGSDQDKDEFPFLNQMILNPIRFLQNECFKTALPAKVGPIHGDLHPSNVIIDKNQNVHLIDFAWAREQGHILKDYLLMECSLRFMLFPHYVYLQEQLEIDELLLEPDGAQKLQTWTSPYRLQPYYQRLGKLLTILRAQAADYFVADGDQGFLEYLAAQFLVLYGLLKYDDYNRFIAARALGLIAKRLSDRRFGMA